MMSSVVVTTADPGTADATKALEQAVASNWPGSDFRAICSRRLEGSAHFSDGVAASDAHDTAFVASRILRESDQVALALPRVLSRLLDDYQTCVYIGPGLLVRRRPDELLAASLDKGTALVVPATITPVYSLTPSLGPIEAGPFLPEVRVAAVTRASRSFLDDWERTLQEAVVDVDQRSVAWASDTFVQRSLARADVEVEGLSTFLNWTDYAAVQVGRSEGPDAAIVACDSLFSSARETDPDEEHEVAWSMLVHRVHDSRPIEPMLRLIEASQEVRREFAQETPFDLLRAEAWRAADPFGRKWGDGQLDRFDDWLFEANDKGCSRVADLLVKDDEYLFRRFFDVRFNPAPLKEWFQDRGRRILGFDAFDQSYEPRMARELPDKPENTIANALAWRWNTIKSLIPGYTRRASRRLEVDFIGPDPAEERGLAPPQHVSVDREPQLWGSSPRELNLIGPFRSESGLGQAARASLEALRSLNRPFSHIDTTEKYPSRNSVDVGLSYTTHGVLGDVNLIHTNADEMLTLSDGAFKHRFGGRFNAAMWFWETADLPDRSRPAFHIVDELWVASQYQRDVFAQYAQVPVHVIGLAADLPRQRDVDRVSYGWEDDELVFLFVYDALSSYGRKNPRKAIEAFIRAFSPSFNGVRFVLKVSNLNKFPASQKELLGLANRYPAITIIDEYMRREEVMDLMSAADVYLSLHAAEGFGLTILEAMALGTPVICTGYSGNMDFTTSDNSWLVGYDMIRTEEPTGPYPKGSVWASPRVSDATEIMREIAGNREVVSHKADLARNDAVKAASLDRYAERLDKQLRRVL